MLMHLVSYLQMKKMEKFMIWFSEYHKKDMTNILNW